MGRAELGAAWADDFRQRHPERTVEMMARMFVEQGLSYSQIGKHFGVSRQRVGQLLGPMNLASRQVDRRRALRAQRLREAHARILAGESTTKQEAETLGYKNVTCLWGAFQQMGLKLRVLTEPPHGTIERYRSRRFRCRCDLCRKANNVFHKGLRDQEREPPTHGLSGYRNYRCRCPICTEANRASAREYRIAERREKEAVE